MFVVPVWENDRQGWSCGGLQVYSVEAICDVDLAEVHWPVSRICTLDFVKDYFERPAKLHCLGWGQANCLFVDLIEGEIVDLPWATVALGNASQWGETEVWKVSNRFERQDGPKGLVVEVRHLVADEVDMSLGRLVWATGGPCLD